MKFLCVAVAGLVASAGAFQAQPAAFTTHSPSVGGVVNDVFTESGSAHRNRRATIVMDGKANGET